MYNRKFVEMGIFLAVILIAYIVIFHVIDDPNEKNESVPEPTVVATEVPSEEPVIVPTEEPVPEPTPEITEEPVPEPTEEPTPEPTPEPTAVPTLEPTSNEDGYFIRPPVVVVIEATPVPTAVPTATPTIVPTAVPTAEPTVAPTEVPMPEPTVAPTEVPMPEPTVAPTEATTPEPTPVPTEELIPVPTEAPTLEPTPVPTEVPTPEPTPVPTEEPTPVPTEEPTPDPTPVPTEEPTPDPTPEPTPVPPQNDYERIKGELSCLTCGGGVYPSYEDAPSYDLYSYISVEDMGTPELFEVMTQPFLNGIAVWTDMQFEGHGVDGLSAGLRSAVDGNTGRIRIANHPENSQAILNIFAEIRQSGDYVTANSIMLDWLYKYTAKNPGNPNERWIIACN